MNTRDKIIELQAELEQHFSRLKELEPVQDEIVQIHDRVHELNRELNRTCLDWMLSQIQKQ